MAGIEDSKLSVVSPLHLGKGGEPPVASPSILPVGAETEEVSAPCSAARIERRTLNRGRKGGRVRVVASRVSVEEYRALDIKARETGLSIGSYLRATALGAAGPRARRSPPINAELLAYAVAQLNRAGNNLNQIARTLNAAQAVGSEETRSAVAETREAVTRILDIVGRRKRHDRQGYDPQ